VDIIWSGMSWIGLQLLGGDCAASGDDIWQKDKYVGASIILGCLLSWVYNSVAPIHSLHSLLHELVDSVRRVAIDIICDLTNNSLGRGRPLRALQAQSSAMCKNAEPSARKCTSRIFSGYPNLVMGLQTDAVLRVFQEGLQVRQRVEVRLSSRLPCVPLPPICFCYRSGTRRFALLYPVSPLQISTTSKFPSLSSPP
jgi:hypothetical protein